MHLSWIVLFQLIPEESLRYLSLSASDTYIEVNPSGISFGFGVLIPAFYTFMFVFHLAEF